MTPTAIIDLALNPALELLPVKMDTAAGRAMLIAIGLQESKFKHRRQVGGGPARGYWQFEEGGGVYGVLTHVVSKPYIRSVLVALDYDPTSSASDCYDAIEHHDILAASFARLLLWTLPQALPTADDPHKGLLQYLAAWQPGLPHEETWDENFKQAWDLVGDL